jgi:hypothetical protein
MRLRIRIILVAGILFLYGSLAYGDGSQEISQPEFGKGKVFEYTATKFGVPFLKATIKIENGSLEEGRSLFQVQAFFHSLKCLGLLFRMNNRFTSTIDAESCSPIRYVKEVDQEGLLIEKKNYLHTLTFDASNKKVVVEKKGGKERQEVFLPSGTYDPLSMFARCYLREELHPGRDIHMSIYDGVKLRQLVFHSRKEKVESKMYGEVEAVRLESSTSFSSFGDREGTLRIWYLTDGGKTPILIELELPVGKVKFELESVY